MESNFEKSGVNLNPVSLDPGFPRKKKPAVSQPGTKFKGFKFSPNSPYAFPCGAYPWSGWVGLDVVKAIPPNVYCHPKLTPRKRVVAPRILTFSEKHLPAKRFQKILGINSQTRSLRGGPVRVKNLADSAEGKVIKVFF